MSNNDKFDRLFIDFETKTRNKNVKYEEGDLFEIVKELKNKRINPYFNSYEIIDFCRRIRNNFQHDLKGHQYFEISEDLIEKLKSIIREIEFPYKVLSKATKNIHTATTQSSVKKEMEIMQEKNYTHIPIYQDKKLIGVFSEYSLFKYLYKNEIIEVTESTKFDDILEYIDMNNSDEVIEFVSKEALYDDVTYKFIENFKKGEKLSCIMVTEHGNKYEYVLGILTAWDILGKE